MDTGNILNLENTIKNYRLGEIAVPLDENHILKWVKQFDEAVQDVILFETTRILETYFFTREDIKIFLNEVIAHLQKELGAPTLFDLFKKCSFSEIQKDGKSQEYILQMLSSIATKKGVTINSLSDASVQNFVYLDDGLYSGSRAIKDLGILIDSVPVGSTLFAFYFCATSFGIETAQKKLYSKLESKNITLKFFRWKIIENQVFTQKEYVDEWTIEESYYPIHKCL